MDKALSPVRSAAAGLLLAFGVATAQNPSGRATHVVSGIVFDSVSSVVLANAVVQLARIPAGDSTPRVETTVTDDAGRYRFAGLPDGRYAIGFQHDALNALGLDAPLRGFELGADTSVIVNLAIDPGPIVRMARCGKDAGGLSDGMLGGFVLGAARESPAVGARVEVRWVETSLQLKGYRSVPRQVSAISGDDGRYLACGVPSDAAIDVVVGGAGLRRVAGQVTIPSGGALRQDFLLPDSGATHGAAAITGRAVHPDSSVVPSGVLGIDALGIETPIRNGAFSLGSLPAGTWFVELKSIGYEPRTLLASASTGLPAPLRIIMEKKAQTLEAIAVIGEASRDTRTLKAVVERGRSSTGTIFLPGNSWFETATHPADVIRAAAGFRYKDQFHVEGRRDCKAVAVYLDGYRFADLETLTAAAPMKTILAIEAYPDIATAPMQFRTHNTYENACAIVAVWTKR